MPTLWAPQVDWKGRHVSEWHQMVGRAFSPYIFYYVFPRAFALGWQMTPLALADVNLTCPEMCEASGFGDGVWRTRRCLSVILGQRPILYQHGASSHIGCTVKPEAPMARFIGATRLSMASDGGARLSTVRNFKKCAKIGCRMRMYRQPFATHVV
jgi:hypothetical protein